MATFTRDQIGFAQAHRTAVLYVDMHDRDIFLYVPPSGDCYEVSIISPCDAIADGTSVSKYNRERVGADEIERVKNELRNPAMIMEGDSWEAQMELMDRWSEAGGTSNIQVAKPFKIQAQVMEWQLREAGVPHPLDTRALEIADGAGEGQPL